MSFKNKSWNLEYIFPTETQLWVVQLIEKKAFRSDKQTIFCNFYWKHFQGLINLQGKV